MRVVENVSYGEYLENKLDMYLPEKEGFETIVYFHGGGLESGDKTDSNYLEVSKCFVEQGYGFVSVNYRMYPQAKFPDYLEDAAKAIAWVKENIQNYGGSDGLYVSGQSAGAWLSIMLCLNGEYLQNAGLSPLEIKGWIIDSAQMTAHFNVLKNEMGINPVLQRINEFAPLYYVSETTKSNPILLLFYEKDIPCRPEQNMLFVKTMQELCRGVDVEYKQLSGGHCHGSTERDEDGEFAYVKESIRWLNRD